MPSIDVPSILEFIPKAGLDVLVIVESGFTTSQVSDDLKKLKVKAFVQKPFRPAEIIAAPGKVDGDRLATTPLRTVSAPKDNDAEVLEALRRRADTSRFSRVATRRAPTATIPNEESPSEPAATPDEPSTSAPPPSFGPPPPQPPATQPPQQDGGFSKAMVGGAPRAAERWGRSHRLPPRPPRWRFTLHNFFLFGGIIVSCIAVASFMAAMRCYAKPGGHRRN